MNLFFNSKRFSSLPFRYLLDKVCLVRLSMSYNSASKERTLQYQETLPSLPVPPLEQSCKKYLKSVEPYLSAAELNETQRLVEDFCQVEGKELHRSLLEKASTSRNWLKRWWEELAYLQPREPICCTVNGGGPFNAHDVWPPVEYDEQTCLWRTAQLIYLLLQYWGQLYRQELPVDKMGKIPLCMNQYYRLLSGCRFPGKDVDSLNDYLQTAPSGHLIILIRGRIYKCQVLDEQLNPLTVPEIEHQLQEIINDSKLQPHGPGLGSLTSENRAEWWKLRKHLIQSNPEHHQMLNDIQTSIFALVIDVKSPCTPTESIRETVLGDCMNRWFDKSYQVISFANGTFGCNMEHAPYDAIIEVNMITDVVEIIKKVNGKVWNGSKEIRQLPKPQELKFELDEVLHEAIHKATIKYNQLANKIHLIAARCHDFGKGFSKKCSIHPDTFIQLALQLTYYRMYKRPACTYETAQTRQFYLGRTETVRSCTNESTAWSKAMLDSSLDSKTKLQLLRQASDKHNQLMKEATNGQGIDRHFLGLQMIAIEQGLPTPKLFQDKAWKLSGGGGNFLLSTSILGYGFTYGSTVAMVENGYGAFYSIEENCFNLCIAEWKTCPDTNAHQFYDNLCQSIKDMKMLLMSSAKL